MEWEIDYKDLSYHPYSIKRRRAEGIKWDYQIGFRYIGWDPWNDNVTLTYYFTENGNLIGYNFMSEGYSVQIPTTYSSGS